MSRHEKQLWSLKGNCSFYYSRIPMNYIHCGQASDTFRKCRAHMYQRTEGERRHDRGSSISDGVNKYPVWVICCLSPTEELCQEPQSTSSPRHSYGAWAHSCLQVKHESICLQNLKKLCFETLGLGERPETVFSEFILRIWWWALFFSCFRFFPRRSSLAVHTSADSTVAGA